MAQRKFAQCLGEFKFEYIGDAKTDDEKYIGKCEFDSSSDGDMRCKCLCTVLFTLSTCVSVSEAGWGLGLSSLFLLFPPQMSLCRSSPHSLRTWKTKES